jgi:hypothetical protein
LSTIALITFSRSEKQEGDLLLPRDFISRLVGRFAKKSTCKRCIPYIILPGSPGLIYRHAMCIASLLSALRCNDLPVLGKMTRNVVICAMFLYRYWR